MSNVIELSTARRSTTPSANRRCDCGSEWFQLVQEMPDGADVPGAVVMESDGHITGYAGDLRCADCGKYL